MLDNFVVRPGSFLWIWQLLGMLPPVALVLGENILQVGPSRCGGIALAFVAHNLRLLRVQAQFVGFPNVEQSVV
ncbi:hypothetical protein C8J56DRAFT_972783, partial [Mycena floridula]